MNPVESFASIAAGRWAVLITIVLIAIVCKLVFGRRSTIDGAESRALVRRARSGPVARVIGIAGALGACVLFALDTARRHDPLAGETGDTEITRVLEAGTESDAEFDRLQIVAAVFESSPSAPPVALHERIVALRPGDVTKAEFPALKLEVTASRSDREGWKISTGVAILHVNMPRARSFKQYRGLGSAIPITAPGARPLFATGQEEMFVFGTMLRSAEPPRWLLFVRPLYRGDVLARDSAEEVGAEIGRAVRHGELSPIFGSTELDNVENPYVRLFSDTEKLGGVLLLMCLIAVAFSIRFIPGVAAVVFAAVAILSLASRLDVAGSTARLEHSDPAERMRAAARLGAEHAFAGTAMATLREHFDAEPDPEVRTAIVLSLRKSWDLRSSPVRKEILAAARSDPSPVVVAAAARVE